MTQISKQKIGFDLLLASKNNFCSSHAENSIDSRVADKYFSSPLDAKSCRSRFVPARERTTTAPVKCIQVLTEYSLCI